MVRDRRRLQCSSYPATWS
ncbi:hypothetical protein KSF78_0008221 [Schistosoma japonicum]|nr:hypothetical protein KSF78_0008221 [Schistosoma japonicum]